MEYLIAEAATGIDYQMMQMLCMKMPMRQNCGMEGWASFRIYSGLKNRNARKLLEFLR